MLRTANLNQYFRDGQLLQHTAMHTTDVSTVQVIEMWGRSYAVSSTRSILEVFIPSAFLRARENTSDST